MRQLWYAGRQLANFCERTHLGAYAAQGAFFLLLSAIPFFMILCSLLQFLGTRGEAVAVQLLELLPKYLEPFLIFLFRESFEQKTTFLSITALVAFWSAGKGVQSMTEGLCAARDVPEKRGWLQVRLWSVLYVILLVFIGTLFILATLFLPLAKVWLFFFLCAFLPFVFQILPRDVTGYVRELPGGMICGIGWYLFSWGMSFYIRCFQGFSMYGRLGTVVLVMLWLYCCMYLLLLCAGLSSGIRALIGGRV